MYIYIILYIDIYEFYIHIYIYIYIYIQREREREREREKGRDTLVQLLSGYTDWDYHNLNALIIQLQGINFSSRIK